MKRPGQPVEVAPCYLFLASDDGSYMSGQFLHLNGGEIINGSFVFDHKKGNGKSLPFCFVYR